MNRAAELLERLGTVPPLRTYAEQLAALARLEDLHQREAADIFLQSQSGNGDMDGKITYGGEYRLSLDADQPEVAAEVCWLLRSLGFHLEGYGEHLPSSNDPNPDFLLLVSLPEVTFPGAQV